MGAARARDAEHEPLARLERTRRRVGEAPADVAPREPDERVARQYAGARRRRARVDGVHEREAR